MYLPRSRPRTEVSFDEPLTRLDGNERSCPTFWTDEAGLPPLEDDPDADADGGHRLPEQREREIILLRFGLPKGREYTQKEVADMLGISQSYISRLEKRIIDRLRKEMLRLQQI